MTSILLIGAGSGPNETPEGQNCGLVKNAAQMIDVSESVDEDLIKDMLSEAGVDSAPDGWVKALNTR